MTLDSPCAGPTGVRLAGPRSLLIEFATLDDVLAHHQHLAEHPLRGQIDVVAAARTLLLRFDSRPAARRGAEALEQLQVSAFSAGEARRVELEVVYDGEDLDDVAEHLGLSVEGLIEQHTSRDWIGAFGGFAPGFTYCVPAENPDQVPRRHSPRTQVPAGSVALAGEFSAVYPRESPGGWQLIGRTAAVLWDVSRESPALVRPGDTVRYCAVTAEALTSHQTAEPAEARAEAGTEAGTGARTDAGADAVLEVLAPGLRTLVQDFGRAGLSDLGVSRAGVADENAMRQANRLAGNDASAPVLEVLHGGLRLQACATSVLAVCGAETPLKVTGKDGSVRHPALYAAFTLLAGDRLELAAPNRGLRSVVALRGGIAAEPVLGSASADTMSGLGPAPLEAGDLIRLGGHPVHAVSPAELSTLVEQSAWAEREDGAVPLRFTRGPRDDWFDEEEVRALSQQRWVVTQESDRIGIRVEPADGGRPLTRARTDELPSEGVVRGSLQMPPSGLPVLFLNDHPVTGGYPVIGVVVPEDMSHAAQLAPGDLLRLIPVDPDTLAPEDAAAAGVPEASDTPDTRTR
ncbi:5-oxoprolinase subunit B/C family protein [Nesterenkonia aerolata]|uniref:Carboxyltransferase domain-containing protein n=1 Tax=Nesterenkonia aerolata TaxID=3074079 RepID=A0ABU2DPS3_9MICC|nr:carboxyltransferase domain-containing protein [Nesterenkonia sp. LY-0111]MDR8018310.1 carboxyltransferase domain-containing protein [Nesterenkonia sp. LY-0111]